MIKPNLLVTMACVFTTQFCYANSSDFQKWLNQEQSEFQEYRDKRDKEFTAFLKTQWREMQTFQGLIRDKTPKPVNIPVAPDTPETKPLITKPSKVITIPQQQLVPIPGKKPDSITPPSTLLQPTPEPHITQPPLAEPLPVKPADKKPAIKPGYNNVRLTFFGNSLLIHYDQSFSFTLRSPVNKGNISHTWDTFSRADYEGLLQQLRSKRDQLSLNDWAYALLIDSFSKQLYTDSRQQDLLNWFLLVKSGYQARFAYDKRSTYLLLPSRQRLFATPYFNFDNTRYYVVSFDSTSTMPGKIFTYDGQYPGANRRLDMRIHNTILTGRTPKSRDLRFSFQSKPYNIRVSYDDQMIAFLNTYPQLDISLYFNSRFNEQTSSSVLKQLGSAIEGMGEIESVNFLLRFVQTAFQYQTDEQQFGLENYLFPEETLHYPYSDCEDRSVLFSWLVRNLINIDVIGLDYPGHIATAVKLKSKIAGDKVSYKGATYTVADPTYINASVGMSMPQFRKHKPDIIPVLN